MARANLTVSDELAALFVEAQSGDVRCIFATVEGEELVSRGTCEASGTAKDDFPRVCERLGDGEPRFVLYRLDSEAGDPAKWAFISYVPEETHVRTKMLFASSSDDFKRQLGPSFFTHEAHAADKGEMVPDLLDPLAGKHAVDDVLTESERLVRQEKTMEREEPSGSRDMVQFGTTDAFERALRAFDAGESQFVEILIDEKEKLHAASERTLQPGETPTKFLGLEDVRFYAVAFKPAVDSQATRLFVYSCPDTSPIKQRMMYSTCKASFLAHASRLGVEFHKNVEVREPIDLADHLDNVHSGGDSGQSPTTDSGAVSSGSVEHTMAFAKPAGPRRGKRRLLRRKE